MKAEAKLARWKAKYEDLQVRYGHLYRLYSEAVFALEMIKDHQFRKVDMDELSITAWQEIEMLRDFAGRKARGLKEKE